MKYFGINMNLGDTNFGVPKKCVLTEPSALLAGSAITGGTSILGSMLGVASQSAANKANLQIARENNAAQYKMFKEANDFNRQERLEAQKWNRDMWKEQQLYNTPVAQAARLSAAGLNAGNIMSGNAAQSVGTIASSSPASSVTPPSMQAAHVEPVYNASDTAALASSFSSAVKQLQEANAVSLDNQTKLQKNMLEIDEMRSRIRQYMDSHKLSKVQYRILEKQDKELAYQNLITKFNLDHQQDSWRMTNEQHDALMGQFASQKRKTDIESDILEINYNLEKEFGFPLKQRQLRAMDIEYRKAQAEIGLLLSQKDMTNAQKDYIIQQKSESVARATGINQQNEHFNAVKDYIKTELEASAAQSKLDMYLSNYDYDRMTGDGFMGHIHRMFHETGSYLHDVNPFKIKLGK